MHKPLVAALLLAGTGLVIPASAEAGGVGLLAMGGTHQERVFYYNDQEKQWVTTQSRPNMGTGFQLALGSQDDRIMGVVKAYYMRDEAPLPPSNPDVPNPTYAIRTAPEHIGVCTVGIEWGLLPDPVRTQAYLATHIGTGVVTVDGETMEASNLEFGLGELGVGGWLMVARNVQLQAEASAAVRYRKIFAPGMSAYLGVRYLFD